VAGIICRTLTAGAGWPRWRATPPACSRQDLPLVHFSGHPELFLSLRDRRQPAKATKNDYVELEMCKSVSPWFACAWSPDGARQGLTLVHLFTCREHLMWDTLGA